MLGTTNTQAREDIDLLTSALTGGNPFQFTESQVIDALRRHSAYLVTTGIAMENVARKMEQEGVSSIAPFRRALWEA